MKLNAKRTALVLVVIIFGGILMLMVSGLWITESTKIPVRISEGEFAGMADPGDIRGSYTFEDIENSFSVPATILAQAFALDTSDKDAKLYKAKDLETFYENLDIEGEVGTDSVRLFVALYLGMSYEAEETSLLPNPAVNILRDKGVLSDELFQSIKAKSVSPAAVANLSADSTEGVSITHSSNLDDMLVKGKTTFANLLDWGMSKTQIEEIIGKPYGSKSQTVRDFALESGIEFSEFKTAMQEILDAF